MTTESDTIEFNLMFGFGFSFFFFWDYERADANEANINFFSFSLFFWTRHYYKRLALQIIELIIHFKAQKGGTYVV